MASTKTATVTQQSEPDGTPKGPARSPTQREVFAARRVQRVAQEEAAKAKAAAESITTQAA